MVRMGKEGTTHSTSRNCGKFIVHGLQPGFSGEWNTIEARETGFHQVINLMIQ